MLRICAGLVCALLLAGAGHSAPAKPVAPPVIQVVEAPAKFAVHPSDAEALRFVQTFSPSELRREGELRTVRNDFVKTLRTNPSMAEVLDAFPTLGPELTKAMESRVDAYIAAYDAQFFPRAADIVQQGLSRDDVITLTTFYGSPLGRKLLQAAAQKVDATEIAQLGLKGQEVDSAVLTRQAFRSGVAIAKDMTLDERKQFLAWMQTPAARHLAAVRPKIIAVQVEIMNHPGADFEEGTKKVLDETLQRVTVADPTPSRP